MKAVLVGIILLIIMAYSSWTYILHSQSGDSPLVKNSKYVINIDEIKSRGPGLGYLYSFLVTNKKTRKKDKVVFNYEYDVLDRIDHFKLVRDFLFMIVHGAHDCSLAFINLATLEPCEIILASNFPPSISPNGQRVAFGRWEGRIGPFETVVMLIDYQSSLDLINGFNYQGVVFPDDEKKLIYKPFPIFPSLVTINKIDETYNPETSLTYSYPVSNLLWSKDSNKLLFIVEEGDDEHRTKGKYFWVSINLSKGITKPKITKDLFDVDSLIKPEFFGTENYWFSDVTIDWVDDSHLRLQFGAQKYWKSQIVVLPQLQKP